MNLLLEYKDDHIVAVIRSEPEVNNIYPDREQQSRRERDIEDGIIIKAILIRDYSFTISQKFIHDEHTQTVILKCYPESDEDNELDPRDKLQRIVDIANRLRKNFAPSQLNDNHKEIIASVSFSTKMDF